MNTVYQSFVNSLQLCIQSTISDLKNEGSQIQIYFSRFSNDDNGLRLFEKLQLGSWDKSHAFYSINIESREDVFYLSDLTYFFLLTRLKEKSILQLAKKSERARKIAEQLNLLKSAENSIEPSSVSQAVSALFSILKEKNMTFRELSEKTGLSQMTLHKAKAGGDLRLSNFLKIAEALGFRVKLEQS